MTEKKWFNVEIPYNTRTMIERVCAFREYLYENNIKHETSQAGNNVHFEILATEKDVAKIDNALDNLVWFDTIH